MTRGTYLIFFLLRTMLTTERPWNIWASTNESLASSSETGGIISKNLFEQLFIDGVHLADTPKEWPVKNALMFQHDKIMLRKRSLIETVNDQLKNICQVELDPPSLLPKLHYQSVIGFVRFLLLRQKTFHQHRRGDCTHLFPAGCLDWTHVP